MTKKKMKTIAQNVVRHFGTQQKLAKALGVTQSAVWNWLNRDKPIPVQRALQIESVTKGKIEARDIRPDFFA